MKRLLAQSKDLRLYSASYSTSLPSGKSDGARNVELFPRPSGFVDAGMLPVPAFAVPAVIEALKKSERYSSFTTVVPGEADPFCALRVHSHGGVILTSDSDLLVHDLGPGGSVAFFKDLELKSEAGKQAIFTAEYDPADICARLSITPEKGIPALAFELSMSPSSTLEQAVERCKTANPSKTYATEYSDFNRPYLSPEVVEAEAFSAPGLVLDPRVSELVLKVHVLSSRHRRTTEDAEESEGGIDGVLMYLPFLLDSPSRTSAWEASLYLRQLAYGFLQIFAYHPIQKVLELRRPQSLSGGTHVHIPQRSSLDSACLEVTETISRIRKINAPPDIQWVLFSVYHDIFSVDQGNSRSLGIQILQMEAKGKLKTTSWEFVHFVAQVQGTLYSLRMLQQIMDFVFHQADNDLTEAFAGLRSYLSNVPSLDGFPSLNSMAPLLRQISQSGCLSAFAATFQFPDEIAAQLDKVLHPDEGKRPKVTKQSQPARNRRASNNPFDILRRG